MNKPTEDRFECPACGQWRDLKTAVRFSDTLICLSCEEEPLDGPYVDSD